MFTSLRSRLWLTYAVLIFGVLCIVAIGIVTYLAQNPARTLSPRLQDAANRLQKRAELLDDTNRE
jgi:glycerol uptake facilitator-like aquaporin